MIHMLHRAIQNALKGMAVFPEIMQNSCKPGCFGSSNLFAKSLRKLADLFQMLPDCNFFVMGIGRLGIADFLIDTLLPCFMILFHRMDPPFSKESLSQ
ncbi:MAG: hypothetical protein PUC47_06810 [Oscillospiraceae bacterium]|nr:hypothetical protein [Oscillospiraceae bacterium]